MSRLLAFVFVITSVHAHFLKEDLAKYAKIIKAAGIEPQ